MKRFVIVGFVLVASMGAASAKTVTGNDLLEACRRDAMGAYGHGESASFDEGECLGNLEAIMHLSDIISVDNKGPDFCIPDGVTVRQMAKVVVNFLDRHPEQLHRPFSWSAHRALMDVWPCK